MGSWFLVLNISDKDYSSNVIARSNASKQSTDTSSLQHVWYIIGGQISMVRDCSDTLDLSEFGVLHLFKR